MIETVCVQQDIALTNKNEFLIGSEIGIIDYDLTDIIEHGKLCPGESIAFDFKAKVLLTIKK